MTETYRYFLLLASVGEEGSYITGTLDAQGDDEDHTFEVACDEGERIALAARKNGQPVVAWGVIYAGPGSTQESMLLWNAAPGSPRR